MLNYDIEIKHDTDVSLGAKMGKANMKDDRWSGRILDWEALSIYLIKNKVQNCSIGLAEDWFFTGGALIREGKIVLDSNWYWIHSTWATPVAICDDEVIPLWKLMHQQKYGTKAPMSIIMFLMLFDYEIDEGYSDEEELEEFVKKTKSLNEYLSQHEDELEELNNLLLGK